MAREYSVRSCAYRAILAHENEHVAFANKLITRYGPRLRSALTSLLIPKARASWLVDTVGDGVRMADSLIERLLKPIWEEIKVEADKGNARIDLPISYKRVQDRCRDW